DVGNALVAEKLSLGCPNFFGEHFNHVRIHTAVVNHVVLPPRLSRWVNGHGIHLGVVVGNEIPVRHGRAGVQRWGAVVGLVVICGGATVEIPVNVVQLGLRYQGQLLILLAGGFKRRNIDGFSSMPPTKLLDGGSKPRQNYYYQPSLSDPAFRTLGQSSGL